MNYPKLDSGWSKYEINDVYLLTLRLHILTINMSRFGYGYSFANHSRFALLFKYSLCRVLRIKFKHLSGSWQRKFYSFQCNRWKHRVISTALEPSSRGILRLCDNSENIDNLFYFRTQHRFLIQSTAGRGAHFFCSRILETFPIAEGFWSIPTSLLFIR